MKKAGRVRVLCLAMVMLLGLLTGCSSKGNPLPEGMEEETVLKAGREVVELLTTGEYQAVANRFRSDVAESSAITAETVKAVMDTVEKAGAYVEESDAMATGQTNKDTGEEYAVAVLFGKHEKKNVRYRVAFDQNMVLIGLDVRKI